MPAQSRQGRTINRANASLPKGLCCIPCRERRVRCDGGSPCSSCVRKARWDGRSMDTMHLLCIHAPPKGSASSLGPATPPDPLPKHLETIGKAASADGNSSDGNIDLSPFITAGMLLPENTMDAFAIASTSRLESAGHSERPVARPPRETTKAAVASSSTGPLQKGLACLSCKQRRVKCDGLKPSCSSCVRNARWNGRDPAEDHGCVYRADLPPPPLPAYLTTAALAAGPVYPMAPPSTSSSASNAPNSLPSTPAEEKPAPNLEGPTADVKPQLPSLPPLLPPLPSQARALYPFRHAPESPRSLPSLYSSADDSTTASTCPSPIPSPALSPHGTPHAFFGHDLLRISYPPVPYPPTDAWDNFEELTLPAPAFDFSKLTEFKLGGRDGWLTGSESLEMTSQVVSVDSFGLSMELDSEFPGGAGGDRKRRRLSEEQPQPTTVSPEMMMMLPELASQQVAIKQEPEDWQVQLENCLSSEVTSGWAL